jgi:hypothetical protein
LRPRNQAEHFICIRIDCRGASRLGGIRPRSSTLGPPRRPGFSDGPSGPLSCPRPRDRIGVGPGFAYRDGDPVGVNDLPRPFKLREPAHGHSVRGFPRTFQAAPLCKPIMPPQGVEPTVVTRSEHALRALVCPFAWLVASDSCSAVPGVPKRCLRFDLACRPARPCEVVGWGWSSPKPPPG